MEHVGHLTAQFHVACEVNQRDLFVWSRDWSMTCVWNAVFGDVISTSGSVQSLCELRRIRTKMCCLRNQRFRRFSRIHGLHTLYCAAAWLGLAAFGGHSDTSCRRPADKSSIPRGITRTRFIPLPLHPWLPNAPDFETQKKQHGNQIGVCPPSGVA